MKRSEIEKLTADEVAPLIAELFSGSDILEKAYCFKIEKNQFTKKYWCYVVFVKNEYLAVGSDLSDSLNLAISRAALLALIGTE